MQQPSMGKSIPNSDWISDEGIELKKEDLPELPGYHVLVQPVSIKQKTKGGIILPDSTKDDIAYLTTVGKVVALGDLAYDDKEKFPLGPWCQEGDYVAYGKLIGQKLQYKGVKLLLLFDDQIIMRVDKPSDLDPTFNLSN
jgi:co-chaperonin GroES (HSP10)